MASSKKLRIAGWILSGIIAAMLIGSAMGKFTEWEGKAEALEHLGYSSQLLTKIGVLEITLAILFMIPRTGFLGAILLTGYLGGAAATHIRVGDPFFMPILIGVVLWLAFTCRRPEVFSLAMGARPASSGPKPATNEP